MVIRYRRVQVGGQCPDIAADAIGHGFRSAASIDCKTIRLEVFP